MSMKVTASFEIEDTQSANVTLDNKEFYGSGLSKLIGTSAALQRVLGLVRMVAPTDSTVLIQGETGTLTSYAWPGNIRELQNFIERSVILSTGSNLRSSFESSEYAAETESVGATTMKDVEREHIRRILEQTRWVVGGCSGALCLGIKRTTLYNRLQRLGISRSDREPIPS